MRRGFGAGRHDARLGRVRLAEAGAHARVTHVDGRERAGPRPHGEAAQSCSVAQHVVGRCNLLMHASCRLLQLVDARNDLKRAFRQRRTDGKYRECCSLECYRWLARLFRHADLPSVAACHHCHPPHEPRKSQSKRPTTPMTRVTAIQTTTTRTGPAHLPGAPV